MGKVYITDTILRDAHQSQAATRMRTDEMLEAGYPWEEWYKDPSTGEFQHHILYLKKTDRCDMTFDCPPTDTTHPEPTRNHFWYLYNDTDSRLLYAR